MVLLWSFKLNLNLGVIFDSNLTFDPHVQNTVKVSFFHLRNTARLRPMLSFSVAEKLINTFVFSRIDYCNALLTVYALWVTGLFLRWCQNSGIISPLKPDSLNLLVFLNLLLKHIFSGLHICEFFFFFFFFYLNVFFVCFGKAL